MIRYNYNRQMAPPAPLVHVTLRRPDRARELVNLPAQLDTAADKTVIPSRHLEELGAHFWREVLVSRLGGYVGRAPAYLLQVSIRDVRSIDIEVIGGREEPLILLGRDVLNHYRILLDGPGMYAELE